MSNSPLDGTNVILDGGLATALQADGLPKNTPVDDWIADQPERVQAAHARFAAAGAGIVLTGTLRTLPHIREDWAEIADSAVSLALRGAGTAQVWASIGPASTADHKWADAGVDDRDRLTKGWSALAARCAEAGVAGIVLETFVDPVECAAAVTEVRSVIPQLPVTACLVPRDDGKLMDGSDAGPELLKIRQAGASWVGFNCASTDAIEAAVALAPDVEWVKPSSDAQDHEKTLAALVRLAQKCHFVGGCCGVDAEVIAELRKLSDLGFPAPRSTAKPGETL